MGACNEGPLPGVSLFSMRCSWGRSSGGTVNNTGGTRLADGAREDVLEGRGWEPCVLGEDERAVRVDRDESLCEAMDAEERGDDAGSAGAGAGEGGTG